MSKTSIYKSINPLNNKLFHTQAMHSDAEVEQKIQKAHTWFLKNKTGRTWWWTNAVEDRFEKLSNVHGLMLTRLPEYAELMTKEMGKPLAQSEGEIMKSAGMIEWSIKHSLELMRDRELKTHQLKAFVTHDAVGPILDIVPWNFPFWMPFKSMIPPLVLGNPILLKHAPSTPLCALALEKLFIDAGFDEGEY